MADDFAAIFCVVGGRSDLSDATLANVVRHLNATVRLRTTGPVHLAIDGYDADARELWEIPEVVSYIRRLISGIDPEVMARLDEQSRIVGAVCCGLLRPIGKNHVTGATLFEPTGGPGGAAP